MIGLFSTLPQPSQTRRLREQGEAKKDWVSFFASSLHTLRKLSWPVCIALLLVSCGVKPERLHMGAGPGLPLLLAKTLAEQLSVNKAAEIQPAEIQLIDMSDTDVRTVGDCCAAVSQWALSSRELDMAIMCPDAARILVKNNADYVLAGPVLLDGDVLVRKPNAQKAIQRVGMSHQRSAQRRLIQETLGPDVEIVEMLPAALTYALERDAVEAVVLDRLTATKSAMPLRELTRSKQQPSGQSTPVDQGGQSTPVDQGGQSTPVEHSGQITQVLVLHKRLTEGAQFTALATALREAVDTANEQLKTLQVLQPFDSQQYNQGGGAAEWTKISTKFVSPLDSLSANRLVGQGAGKKQLSGGLSPFHL